MQLTNKLRGGGVHKSKKPSKMMEKRQKQESQASETRQVKIREERL